MLWKEQEQDTGLATLRNERAGDGGRREGGRGELTILSKGSNWRRQKHDAMEVLALAAITVIGNLISPASSRGSSSMYLSIMCRSGRSTEHQRTGSPYAPRPPRRPLQATGWPQAATGPQHLTKASRLPGGAKENFRLYVFVICFDANADCNRPKTVPQWRDIATRRTAA